MRYDTIAKRIKAADDRAVLARTGIHGYDESIEVLSATEQLCHYTVMMLKKCKDDHIPFQEYEVIMKKNMEGDIEETSKK